MIYTFIETQCTGGKEGLTKHFASSSSRPRAGEDPGIRKLHTDEVLRNGEVAVPVEEQ